MSTERRELSHCEFLSVDRESQKNKNTQQFMGKFLVTQINLCELSCILYFDSCFSVVEGN